MDINRIKEIIAMFEESQVALMELEVKDLKIKLEKSGKAVPMTAIPELTISQNDKFPASDNVHAVKSPLVGTYYAAAGDGSEPYVKVGSRVKVGDVICIIEAMKVMNEIRADKEGVVKEILVSNGQMVQYDDVLIKLGE